MFLVWCSLKIDSYFYAIKPFGFSVLATTENEHSKSRIIKSSKKLLVLMSSGKRGGNLFYISKQYYENLKQVRKSLKPAQSV